MGKEYQGELKDNLPADHPDAIEHPVLEYDSYYDYTDQFSNYAFDKFAKETLDDVVNLKLKFRGKAIDNVMQAGLPFIREKSKALPKNSAKAASLASWYLNNEIGSMTHGGYKETVKTDKHPTLCKIVEWFEFTDDVQPIILEKNIGDYQLWHVDCHCGHSQGFRQGNVIRLLVHLQDWEFGQMLQWGTQAIAQWKAGDALIFDDNIPHASGNASRFKRYTLRLTGTPSENTLKKLEQGGTIDVDLL
jgi:hypothetical protein